MADKIRKFSLYAVTVLCWIGLILVAVFPLRAVLQRLLQSLWDLCTAVGYYFCYIFVDEVPFDSTVIEIPNGMQSMLPIRWEDFVSGMQEFWTVLWSKENLASWAIHVINVLEPTLRILLLLLPLIVCLCFLIPALLFRETTDKGETVHLKRWLWLEDKIFKPCIAWMRDCWRTLTAKGWKRLVFLLLFFVTFNLMTICIEVIAYVFYFAASWNVTSVYIQFVKLFYDVMPIIQHLPFVAWVIIACGIIHYLRRRKGEKNLARGEAINREFLRNCTFATLITGLMGTGKTTVIVDMSLSTDVMLKEKALDMMKDRTLFFPDFPWSKFEADLKDLMSQDKHVIYDFSSARSFMEDKTLALDEDPKALWGYDSDNKPMLFDTGIGDVFLIETLLEYMCLFLIYTQPSLILSNLAIRQDNHLEDIGNFPLWKSNFFALYSSDKEHYSHILNFDMLRPVKQIDGDLESKRNRADFNFGINTITEIGKERGNQIENAGKKKVSDETNQLNDGFNKGVKMRRHPSTVGNYAFWREIWDEQRAQSLGADAENLAGTYKIVAKTKDQLAMPLFFVAELLYAWIKPLFNKVWEKYRYSRGDDCLLWYWFRKSVGTFLNHYKRTYNLFGFYVVSLQMLDGGQPFGEPVPYVLNFRKIYNRRFATDCYSEFFHHDNKISKKGLIDVPCYTDVTASIEELQSQNSYFIRDLDGTTERERQQSIQ